MIDTATYLLTQHNPGGPIIRPEDPSTDFWHEDDVDDRPLTRGRLIGGIISAILLVGAGIYLAFTLR